MNISVMSFNIRYSRGKDGKNVWANRKHLVGDLIRRYSPDIIGFQEALQDQMDDLEKMLPDYLFVGVGREDGKDDGEYNPLFYKNTFELASSDTFWLSDTPDEPSCTWGGQTRICTWAYFTAPAEMWLYNTHFEYSVPAAQIKSAKLVAEVVGERPGSAPAFITGDFNMRPGSEPYQILATAFKDVFLEDAGNRRESRIVSFHGFTGRKCNSMIPWARKPCRMDIIWAIGQITVRRCRVIQDQPGHDPDLYPSDHWPVLAEVSI